MSIKKRIRPGLIEPSNDGSSIVIHFTTETTYLDSEGETARVEKVPDKKELPVLRLLRGHTVDHIPAVAQDIIQRCRYVPESKARELEKVLLKIHTSSVNGGSCSFSSTSKPPLSPSTSPTPVSWGSDGFENDHRTTRRERERKSSRKTRTAAGSPSIDPCPSPSTPTSSDFLPSARISSLDDYVEELYEDRMEAKALGAQHVLRLCYEVRPLIEISEHPTILGVLSRELRENAKRSNELSVAIIGIFLCFARFRRFHDVLSRHDCDDVIMRVVEYEGRRRLVWQNDLDALRTHTKSKVDQDRLVKVIDRQDRLLQLCLLVLRSLAEELHVQKGLEERQLCSLLLPALSSNCKDLLPTVLGVLHRLSLFESSKNELVKSVDALGRLAELVGHPSFEVAHMALRLCYNLSFDREARSVMAHKTSLIGRLRPVVLLGPTQRISMRLLYQLTIDPALRGLIATRYPECIAMALEYAVASAVPEHPKDQVEAVALCVNFASDKACASVLADDARFPLLVTTAMRRYDAVLMKVLRNVIRYSNAQRRVLKILRDNKSINTSSGGHEWLGDLTRLAIASAGQPGLLVESLGVLSNLRCQDIPWPWLCELGLLDLLCRLLIVGFSEDDVLLEAIMIVSNIAMDVNCDGRMAISKVPGSLLRQLTEKRQDDEITTQLLFSIRCLLIHEESRELVLSEDDFLEFILDILNGRSDNQEEPTVQAVKDGVLSFVSAVEDYACCLKPTWAERIKTFRFEIHNEGWCQYIQDAGLAYSEVPRLDHAKTMNSHRWQDSLWMD